MHIIAPRPAAPICPAHARMRDGWLPNCAGCRTARAARQTTR